MKIFIKKIDDDGNIEISAFKNINAGNDFDSLLYPPEDVCIKGEEINIFDLLEENKKLKKENDILLSVQEDCEKSLHKIRELKKELNKVNEENKKLKEQIKIYEDPEDLTLIFMYCDIEAKDKIKELKNQLKKCKEDNNELRKDKLECYIEYTTMQTSLNKFVEYLEKRYKDITSVIGSYGSNTDMLYGKKNMTEEILTEFKNMVEEFQKTERLKK